MIMVHWPNQSHVSDSREGTKYRDFKVNGRVMQRAHTPRKPMLYTSEYTIGRAPGLDWPTS